MKRILIILIICTGVANAQDSQVASTIVNDIYPSLIHTMQTSQEDMDVSKSDIQTISKTDQIAYGRTSKIAFFEVLIAKNNLGIQLKDSKTLASRSTEEMVSKQKNKILYASIE